MNCAFSLDVLAGNESKKRIVETKMLSKYRVSWNSRALSLCARLLVIKRGSTEAEISFGSGLEERKLLLCKGTDDEEAKIFL